jgi:hypothetical protein
VRININLKPKKKPRDPGMTVFEQLVTGLLVSAITVGVIHMLVQVSGTPTGTPKPPTVCEQLMALAETRADTLLVFTTKPGSSSYTCFEEFQNERR